MPAMWRRGFKELPARCPGSPRSTRVADQHRIVARVEELMALCDRLEARLTAVRTESGRLLEAVLHETLAASA
jgi:hypothetical protein